VSLVLIVLGVVPLLRAPFLFVGYARTRRLQRDVGDPRLRALGWFFLLYGLATVFLFVLHITFPLEQQGIDVGSLAGQLLLPDHAPLAAWALLWIRHALILAALLPVASAYLRRPGVLESTAPALLPLALGMMALQTFEAALALLPAVLTFRNYRGRHTRRSRDVATGFGLLAAGHLGLVLILLDPPRAVAAHLIVLGQILALGGAIRLALSVPRRT